MPGGRIHVVSPHLAYQATFASATEGIAEFIASGWSRVTCPAARWNAVSARPQTSVWRSPLLSSTPRAARLRRTRPLRSRCTSPRTGEADRRMVQHERCGTGLAKRVTHGAQRSARGPGVRRRRHSVQPPFHGGLGDRRRRADGRSVAGFAPSVCNSVRHRDPGRVQYEERAPIQGGRKCAPSS